jgi:hydroxymethylglutaryl-CoA synthase
MVGITSCGAYIPRYRIARQTISAAMGWLNRHALPGEKAVTNYDEDSLTMAAAAGMDCIGTADRTKIDGLYFATTTAPYRERESAAIMATALALPSAVRTVDIGNSLKAGTSATLLSCASVKAGDRGSVLVCAADCRLGKPGSSQEVIFGDAATALLIGSEQVIAGLEGSYSVAYDFPDHWRAAFDKFDRTLEDRWIRDEGYTKFISEAITGLLTKYRLEPRHFARVIYPCLYLREHAAIGKRLGFEPHQLQSQLLTTVGDSGAASPLLMLAAALEESQPGDNVLVASYGNGSDALWFKVTPEMGKRRRGWVKQYLNDKQELTSYEQYLGFKGILPVETGLRGEVGPTQLSVAWRERKTILSLCGSRCKRCGVPQYPPQRICVNPACGAIDEMEEYRFSDKKGVLFSYTEDHLAASLNPPQMYGAVDFEGGGRNIFDITDCEADSLSVGMPVKMTFRRKYADEVRGIYGYGWKARPLPGQGGRDV